MTMGQRLTKLEWFNLIAGVASLISCLISIWSIAYPPSIGLGLVGSGLFGWLLVLFAAIYSSIIISYFIWLFVERRRGAHKRTREDEVGASIAVVLFSFPLFFSYCLFLLRDLLKSKWLYFGFATPGGAPPDHDTIAWWAGAHGFVLSGFIAAILSLLACIAGERLHEAFGK